MKIKKESEFFKTITGKALLFLGAIVLGILSLVLGVVIHLYVICGYYEKSLTADELVKRQLLSVCASAADDVLYKLPGLDYQATDSIPKNLIYKVTDQSGETLLVSQESEGELIYSCEFSFQRSEDGKRIKNLNYVWDEGAKTSDYEYVTVSMGIIKGMPYQDDVSSISNRVKAVFYLRYPLIIAFVLSAVAALILYVKLLICAGTFPKGDGKNRANTFPLDLFVLLIYLSSQIAVRYFWQADYLLNQVDLEVNQVIYATGGLLALVLIFSQIRQGRLISSLMLVRILRLIRSGLRSFIRFIQGLPGTGSLMAVLGFILAVNIYLYKREADYYLPHGFYRNFVLFECFLFSFLLLVYAAALVRLDKQVKAMAEGNFDAGLSGEKLPGKLKVFAENLGRISEGMEIAIDERLKSERMKTELITNVSHDIKTPITSIINYTDLIAREETDNEKIREYCEVLSRQSGKLKGLIEDLVEVSRASTGNMELSMAVCDAGVLLSQAAGEYEDKFSRACLTPVVAGSEQSIQIMADPAKLWRVFDNLLGNIVKYGMPGSRVYLKVEEIGKEAVFSFRNVSAMELNISAQELKERFVRGDASRNTEGNGLGLSIAENLVKLQGGRLSITIDGDLFKAEIRMPVIVCDHEV